MVSDAECAREKLLLLKKSTRLSELLVTDESMQGRTDFV